jgi:hypothetical protein
MVFTVDERAGCLLKYRASASGGSLLPLLRLLLLTSGIHAALPKAHSSIRREIESHLHQVDQTTGGLRKTVSGIEGIRCTHMVSREALGKFIGSRRWHRISLSSPGCCSMKLSVGLVWAT